MATIADIVLNGKGRAGSNGSWRVETYVSPYTGETHYQLYHYGTLMLEWMYQTSGYAEPLYMDTGWGSVSDQNGMNTVFRVLGVPYYYSRAGGAEIKDLTAPNSGLSMLPSSLN